MHRLYSSRVKWFTERIYRNTIIITVIINCQNTANTHKNSHIHTHTRTNSQSFVVYRSFTIGTWVLAHHTKKEMERISDNNNMTTNYPPTTFTYTTTTYVQCVKTTQQQQLALAALPVHSGSAATKAKQLLCRQIRTNYTPTHKHAYAT